MLNETTLIPPISSKEATNFIFDNLKLKQFLDHILLTNERLYEEINKINLNIQENYVKKEDFLLAIKQKEEEENNKQNKVSSLIQNQENISLSLEKKVFELNSIITKTTSNEKNIQKLNKTNDELFKKIDAITNNIDNVDNKITNVNKIVESHSKLLLQKDKESLTTIETIYSKIKESNELTNKRFDLINKSISDNKKTIDIKIIEVEDSIVIIGHLCKSSIDKITMNSPESDIEFNKLLNLANLDNNLRIENIFKNSNKDVITQNKQYSQKNLQNLQSNQENINYVIPSNLNELPNEINNIKTVIEGTLSSIERLKLQYNKLENEVKLLKKDLEQEKYSRNDQILETQNRIKILPDHSRSILNLELKTENLTQTCEEINKHTKNLMNNISNKIDKDKFEYQLKDILIGFDESNSKVTKVIRSIELKLKEIQQKNNYKANSIDRNSVTDNINQAELRDGIDSYFNSGQFAKEIEKSNIIKNLTTEGINVKNEVNNLYESLVNIRENAFD